MGQFTKGKRPSATAIKEAVVYFESLGLNIYGANIDLKDGEVRPAQRDYSSNDVIRLRELIDKDLLWQESFNYAT